MYCSDIRTTPFVFQLHFQLGYRIQIFESGFRFISVLSLSSTSLLS